MSKAERLAIAGAVAPSLRGASARVRARRVTLVDENGNVTGYSTLGEVQKALLRAREIELDLEVGAPITDALCLVCGKTFVPRKGPRPKQCDACKAPVCPCGKRMPVRTNAFRARRERCFSCYQAARRQAKTPRVCLGCGAPTSAAASLRCRPCYAAHISELVPVRKCVDCDADLARKSAAGTTRCRSCARKGACAKAWATRRANKNGPQAFAETRPVDPNPETTVGG